MSQGGNSTDLDWLLDIAAGVSWSTLQSIILNPDKFISLEIGLYTSVIMATFLISSGRTNFPLNVYPQDTRDKDSIIKKKFFVIDFIY